jgi:hypothetical protein
MSQNDASVMFVMQYCPESERGFSLCGSNVAVVLLFSMVTNVSLLPFSISLGFIRFRRGISFLTATLGKSGDCSISYLVEAEVGTAPCRVDFHAKFYLCGSILQCD